jgi:hypothetical protein
MISITVNSMTLLAESMLVSVLASIFFKSVQEENIGVKIGNSDILYLGKSVTGF